MALVGEAPVEVAQQAAGAGGGGGEPEMDRMVAMVIPFEEVASGVAGGQEYQVGSGSSAVSTWRPTSRRL